MPRNIALVGCGAVARALYLPVLAKHRAEFDQVWLVDPSDHALTTASSIVSGRRTSRLEDVDEEIQFVIIATANHLHFALACEAIARGADVLIEKPFVIWPEEGRVLVDASAQANRLITVNQTRRFFPVVQELRARIENGEFGALKSIVHPEGARLSWSYESGAAFHRGVQRSGVIMDIGVHVIDLYQYLLRPNWAFVSAIHDGFNGPEGLASIKLRAGDAPVHLRLSRYCAQKNVACLTFETAEVSFNVYEAKTYAVRPTTGKAEHFAAAPGSTDYRSYGEPLVLNFLAASERREPAICDAASSLPVIGILDQVYRQAQHYPDAIGFA